MATVTIDGRAYTSYASLEDADAYLAASLSGAAWRTMDADAQGIRLIEATRLLDRQAWRAAFRSFDARAAVPAIVNASIEIAAGLVGEGADASVLEGAPSQAVKRTKVGPVEEEYFRSFEAAAPLPSRAMAMLAAYLVPGGSAGGARLIGGAFATGVDGISHADAPYGFTRGA